MLALVVVSAVRSEVLDLDLSLLQQSILGLLPLMGRSGCCWGGGGLGRVLFGFQGVTSGCKGCMKESL